MSFDKIDVTGASKGTKGYLNDQDETHPDRFQWPEERLVNECMELVLQHFLHHKELVFGKLKIAKQATNLGINDIEKVCDAYELEDDMPLLGQVKSYESLWDEILERFVEIGMSADDLTRIEAVLTKIPDVIKRHYDVMLEADKVLNDLMRELSDEKYQKALDMVGEIQSWPNPMSRLLPHDYDKVRNAKIAKKSDTSYKIVLDDHKSH